MPTFGGVTGRVYYKAWHLPAPGAAAVVFQHGFGEHSGLYHRLGNALNNAGIEFWALDEIGHGLTEGERAVIRSIDDLVQNGRRLTALAEAVQPGLPVWLAGHSLGSVAAAVAAAREPRRYAGLIRRARRSRRWTGFSRSPTTRPRSWPWTRPTGQATPSTWTNWPTTRSPLPARQARAPWPPCSRRPGMSSPPPSGG